MITKIAYRPYASGVNNTQIQQKKINFGIINEKDARAVQEFAQMLVYAMENPNEMAGLHGVTEAFNVFDRITRGTTVGSIAEGFRNAFIDALLAKPSLPKSQQVTSGWRKA